MITSHRVNLLQSDCYEILTGDLYGLHWVEVNGSLNSDHLFVEGGIRPDGTPLYVAHADCGGIKTPGIAAKGLDCLPFLPRLPDMLTNTQFP